MLDHMVAEGFLKPDMRRMALVAPDAEGALDALAAFAAPDTPRWLRPGEA
jgi:predicted Rossmann-fold nucleotide-binding protein